MIRSSNLLASFTGIGLAASFVMGAFWLHNEQRHHHNVWYSMELHKGHMEETRGHLLTLDPFEEEPDLSNLGFEEFFKVLFSHLPYRK